MLSRISGFRDSVRRPDDSDPAIPVIQRLKQEFPDVAIELIVGSLPAANGKVGVLANLARHAANPVWVVNDSDISVTPEYLWDVVAPLRNLGCRRCDLPLPS